MKYLTTDKLLLLITCISAIVTFWLGVQAFGDPTPSKTRTLYPVQYDHATLLCNDENSTVRQVTSVGRMETDSFTKYTVGAVCMNGEFVEDSWTVSKD